MSVKRQLTHSLTQETNQNASPYSNELQTMGMRIRKAISDGYQTPDNLLSQLNNQQRVEQQQSVFTRVPLPSNVVTPPLLSNATSSMYSTYGSSNLEEWEKNIESRLNTIGENMTHNKITKRSFESFDEEW